MAATDPRVDQYITKAPEFAKPVLERFRALVHKACPDVEETVKWRMPSFEYKGMLCGMAAFKKYSTIGFWKDKLLRDPKVVGARLGAEAGSVLDRIGKVYSEEEFPADKTVLALIKAAVRLNDEDVKVPKGPAKTKPPLKVPTDFNAALKAAGDAKANFDAMSPSHKREYIEWIVEAKTDETRQRRIATAVEWISEKKSRNWKYMRK